MKQSSTTSEYIEPIGFKGTQGEWQHVFSQILEQHWVKGGEKNMCMLTNDGEFDEKESAANAALIAQSKELARYLQYAIAEAEKEFKASKDAADWHNNNTPGVGQTVDYQSYPPLPKWVEDAKQTLIKAGLNQ